MGKKWTRREFLATGLAAPLVSGAAVSTLSAELVQLAPAKKLKASGLSLRQGEVLRAAMDEIVPAGGGMPAASEVGGVGYLDRLAGETPELGQQLNSSLELLETVSRKHFKKKFLRLSRAERVEVLTKLEKEEAPDLFAALRAAVYEAYYTQPAVWKRIGFEFYPPERPGPLPAPFDNAVLARVRRLPKLYREVR